MLRVELDYNSGVAPKWLRVEQPSSISNILQGDSSCLLASFSAGLSSLRPPLALSLFLLLSRVPLFPVGLVARAHGAAVDSFQGSFMPPGGEDLITRGEWIPLSSSPAEFLVRARSLGHDARFFRKLPSHGTDAHRFSFGAWPFSKE